MIDSLELLDIYESANEIEKNAFGPLNLVKGLGLTGKGLFQTGWGAGKFLLTNPVGRTLGLGSLFVVPAYFGAKGAQRKQEDFTRAQLSQSPMPGPQHYPGGRAF